MADLTISTSLYNDETASLMEYVCPEHHNLESWGDLHPSHNIYTFNENNKKITAISDNPEPSLAYKILHDL